MASAENYEVQELYNTIEIHRLALANLKQQIRETQETLAGERANWQLLDKQYKETITTLANQLKNTDNENTEKTKQLQLVTQQQKMGVKIYDQEILKLTQELQCKRREQSQQTADMARLQKTVKMLKKRIKHLNKFIVRCNDTLDDIISEGDNIIGH
ncbi:ORF37 [Plodia interpunctella granulovirus]|uniref:ORF37 n=1 Tax=Plodia interpunctella granulovirus TaxID=262175 RepID=A0A1L5JGK5_9BBAC|nr:ORF37 [Plodia interpunctella granulovirus]APO13921.1 ORF37 [Plodia interpunctella granulovirus]